MSIKYICSNCGSKVNDALQSNHSSGCGCFFVTLMYLVSFICLFTIAPIGVIILILTVILNVVINNGDRGTPQNTCPICKAQNVLTPIDSPKGKELMKTINLL